ncbi:MAG: Carbonyl reductase family er 4 [Frankiales bacterium]|nr:Carbonyl reductase family er 4 [Frankiales bacterium]
MSGPGTGERRLAGQSVVVLGGTAGIGLETARRAHEAGADLIVTARDPDRLSRVGRELGARTFAFDLNDADQLARFFTTLPGQVDHVLVSGAGPRYLPFAELDIGTIRHGVERIVLSVQIAQLAKAALRPTGSLLLIGGTGGRRPSAGPLISAVTAALPALVRSLALELAPARVNLIAPGFVDTPLSATLLGDGLDERREQLRATLPIQRVVGPADVAALAVDLMTNTAVTGATFDIDGGQQLVEG